MPSLAGIVISFTVLGVVFYAVEHWFASIPQQPIRRSGFTVDAIYWAFTPLVTKTLAKFTTFAGVAVVAVLLGRKLGPELANGFGPIAEQPVGLVVIEMLVLGDFIGYWTHRIFHRGWLWRFHAIHHSSTQLDWLSAVRVHPVNDVLSRLVQVCILMLLGFPLTALAAYVPFLTLYAILLHANVGWDYGPLRRVIASPRFHRWHHTSQAQGQDKNFAGLLPLWDQLFGTYYMPAGRQPEVFGVCDGPVPQTFLAQLAYPFEKSRR